MGRSILFRLAAATPAVYLTLTIVAERVTRAGEDSPAAPEHSGSRSSSDARRARAQENALRLATALQEEDALLQLYDDQAHRRDASPATLDAFVAAAEGGGVPDRAVTVLQERIRNGYDAPTSAKLLAFLLSRAGRAAQAATAWRELARLRGRAGLSGEEALAFARVLSRLDDGENAWAVLAAAPPPESQAGAYWHARATLAWQLNRSEDSEHAYQMAWALGERTPEARQRMGLLARLRGEVSSFVELLRRTYADTKDPTDLLEAAQSQLDVGDWGGLGATLTLAGRHAPQRFAELPPYWTLRGAWLSHIGDRALALEAWDRAFSLSRHPTVGADYLRSALSLDRKSELARAVTSVIESGIIVGPELRDPLALALLRLGRGQDALRVKARDIRAAGVPLRLWDPIGEALSATGRTQEQARLRARTHQTLLADHDAVVLGTSEGRERFLDIADTIGAARGRDTRLRWIRWALGHSSATIPRVARAHLWAILREAEDRTTAARALWAEAASDPTLESRANTRLLHLALEENDRPFLRNAIQQARQGSDLALADAALRIGDAHAARTLTTGATRLAGDDILRGQAFALRQLEARQSIQTFAGWRYDHLGVVTSSGANLGGSIPWSNRRLGLELGARNLTSTSTGLLAPVATEADAMFALQSLDDSGSTFSEMATGVDYRSNSLLPRLRVVHERSISARLFLGVRAAFGEPLDDSPLLRVLATAAYLSTTARLLTEHFTGSITVRARNDRSRTLAWLGSELATSAELALRLVRARPEFNVGLRAHAQERRNPSTLPDELATTWPASVLPVGAQLPPSYSFIAVVTRVAYGQLGARFGTGTSEWPRYECGIEFGVRLPAIEPASGGRCSLAIPLGRAAALRPSVAYGWGLLAVARGTSARAAIDYEQRF